MPMRLDDILGQGAAIETLAQSIASGRLPHGMIFAGQAGVGKSTTARALAAWQLCENAETGANKPAKSRGGKSVAAAPAPGACGKCQSCRLIDAGAHPDFHVITRQLIRYHDKTGKSKGIDLSINVLRPELIEPAGRKSSMGRGKAFIVEDAHLMNAAAQNGILKTLEEPPGNADGRGTLIILLADQLESLLPTIRSRCRVIPFAALGNEVVTAALARRGASAADAEAAAAIGNGSLGGAIAIIDDGMLESARQIGNCIDRLVSGSSGPDDLGELLKTSAEAFAKKQIEKDELASKDAATGEGLGIYLRLASQRLGHHLEERAGKARSAASDESLEKICRAIDAIAATERYLDANVNVAVSLQQLSAAILGALRQVG